jgi:hypothetical protein
VHQWKNRVEKIERIARENTATQRLQLSLNEHDPHTSVLTKIVLEMISHPQSIEAVDFIWNKANDEQGAWRILDAVQITQKFTSWN